MLDLNSTLWALLGGILPALIWLAFWLEEDKKRPEPKRLIFKTFIFGMIAVLLVLPLEDGVSKLYPMLGLVPFLLWALLEEGFKFGAAYLGGLKTSDDDEPVDSLIYMITAALGFVALENALFIVTPLLGHDVAATIVTGNLRFIGASLLHTVTSGIIGFSLAASFYKGRFKKVVYTICGFVLAVLFHTAFNFSIFSSPETGTMYSFGAVWLGVAILILMFEKIKAIAPPAETDII